MKNRKYHILSILLIIFMIFLAVSSEAPPPKEIKNSLSYETRGNIFLLKLDRIGTQKIIKLLIKEVLLNLTCVMKILKKSNVFLMLLANL
jgi:hypothetical protein